MSWIQRRAAGGGRASGATAAGGSPGKRSMVQARYGAAPVQRRARVDGAHADAAEVPEVAARGATGAAGTLPFVDEIQRSFGAHDVRGIHAHTGDRAAQASRALGAEAYAMGDDVVFAGLPTLHTAAHEAAHVVQQRAGVQLAGGVGDVDDPYERHADAVADHVVAGASAEALLDTHAGAGASHAVQRKVHIKGDLLPKTSTGRGAAAQALIDDPQHTYYFDSKQELEAYATGATDHIGLVGNTWVRLPEQLTVLGEDHSGVTLMNLVAATRTTKYRYEGITAPPGDQYSLELAGAMVDRQQDITSKKGARDATPANQGEAFLPKVMYMLGHVKLGGNAWDETGMRAMLWAILYAKGDPGPLGNCYRADAAMFDAIVTANGRVGVQADPDVVQAFIDAFAAHARAASAKHLESISPNDRAAFKEDRDQRPNQQRDRGFVEQAKGNPAATDYLRDEADDAREVTMFEHVRRAIAEGLLLFGVGNNHRVQLAPHLDRAGVPHQHMNDFLAAQARKHPQ